MRSLSRSVPSLAVGFLRSISENWFRRGVADSSQMLAMDRRAATQRCSWRKVGGFLAGTNQPPSCRLRRTVPRIEDFFAAALAAREFGSVTLRAAPSVFAPRRPNAERRRAARVRERRSAQRHLYFARPQRRVRLRRQLRSADLPFCPKLPLHAGDEIADSTRLASPTGPPRPNSRPGRFRRI